LGGEGEVRGGGEGETRGSRGEGKAKKEAVSEDKAAPMMP